MDAHALALLVPLFFVTAVLYSSVGFGGGSTYLALLALLAVPYATMPKIALLCNLIVVTGGCYFFLRAGYFSARKTLPFVILSVPAAYVGGAIPVGKTVFLWLLALSLLIAGSRLLISKDSFRADREPNWRTAWLVGLPTGAALGGLSGLVGIGGGIFLSPVLYLLGWARAREVAAAASVFIWLNSAAGLMGQLGKGGLTVDFDVVWPLALAVLMGGQIGSRLGSKTLPRLVLQRGTAVLILIVSGRILWGLL